MQVPFYLLFFMKIFISQPMTGKTPAQIKTERKDIEFYIRYSLYTTEEIDIIDSYEESDRPAIELLGEAISKMADADVVVFSKNWKESKGCRVENLVAELYNIQRIYL